MDDSVDILKGLVMNEIKLVLDKEVDIVEPVVSVKSNNFALKSVSVDGVLSEITLVLESNYNIKVIKAPIDEALKTILTTVIEAVASDQLKAAVSIQQVAVDAKTPALDSGPVRKHVFPSRPV